MNGTDERVRLADGLGNDAAKTPPVLYALTV